MDGILPLLSQLVVNLQTNYIVIILVDCCAELFYSFLY